MTIIFCGLYKGKAKRYACPVCGYESENIDDYATSMCWACVYGFETAGDYEPEYVKEEDDSREREEPLWGYDDDMEPVDDIYDTVWEARGEK